MHFFKWLLFSNWKCIGPSSPKPHQKPLFHHVPLKLWRRLWVRRGKQKDSVIEKRRKEDGVSSTTQNTDWFLIFNLSVFFFFSFVVGILISLDLIVLCCRAYSFSEDWFEIKTTSIFRVGVLENPFSWNLVNQGVSQFNYIFLFDLRSLNVIILVPTLLFLILIVFLLFLSFGGFDWVAHFCGNT